MDLKPQDVVLLLSLLTINSDKRSFSGLAKPLFMSTSHAFESAKRAEGARLLTISTAPPSPPKGRGVLFQPNRSNLKEFLIHGVKYAFPAERSGVTRGVPTAEGAPPLFEQFSEDSMLPPVWPSPEGPVRGTGFSPLYENVPKVAMINPSLYELLALLDAIRDGRAREREFAIRELSARIDSK